MSRSSSYRPRPKIGPRPARRGSSGAGGGLARQVGLFEAANGIPHGPVAIALAILAGVVAYSISRMARMARRR